ncbi:Root hair defective 3 GTP-binding protein, partial [Corchorus capsularis]
PLKVLSVMAAIRVDNKSDEIEEILFTLMDEKSGPSKILSSKQWPKISPEDTLITPLGCQTLWKGFQEYIEEQFEHAKVHIYNTIIIIITIRISKLWVKTKNRIKKILVGTFNVGQVTASALFALGGILIPPILIPFPRGTDRLQIAVNQAIDEISCCDEDLDQNAVNEATEATDEDFNEAA